MTIRRIKSGGVYEDKIGYCRAVVANGFVFVAGTTAANADGSEPIEEQCQDALNIIEDALTKAGSDFSKVVRVTYYVTNMADFEACYPILKSTFGAHPPAATVIEANLIIPQDKIEIEVTATV